jgi:hypothetical protein
MAENDGLELTRKCLAEALEILCGLQAQTYLDRLQRESTAHPLPPPTDTNQEE